MSNAPKRGEAKYIKLVDGTWGIQVIGDFPKGVHVKVTKRDGTVKDEVLGDIVDITPDYTIAKIAWRKKDS